MNGLRETFAHLFHPRFSNNHRPRILHPEGFAFLCLIAIVSASFIHFSPRALQQTGFVLGFSSSITTDKVVSLTNQERQQQGLATLTLNSQLSQAASAKAADMFRDQYWAHYSPTGEAPWDFMKSVGYRYSVAGENLARDFQENDEMMRAWMNSPTHRENIINPKYKEIGVAVVNGTLNGVETTLVVQMFGTSANSSVVAQINDDVQPAKVEREVSSEVIQQQNPDPAIIPQEKVVSESVAINDQPVITQATTNDQESVLAELTSMPSSRVLSHLSPLQLSKAVFLAILMMVMTVLVYDTAVIGNMGTVRFVGKNAAHIMLFMVIFFLVLLFKGGMIK